MSLYYPGLNNGGDVGHNAIIRSISVKIKVGEQTLEQEWLSFAVATRRGVELSFDIKESAHPVVVAGGSAASYMTTFSPRVKDCPGNSGGDVFCNRTADFVSDTEFLNLLAGYKELIVTFLAT